MAQSYPDLDRRKLPSSKVPMVVESPSKTETRTPLKRKTLSASYFNPKAIFWAKVNCLYALIKKEGGFSWGL